MLGFQVVGQMSNVMTFLTATGENHHDMPCCGSATRRRAAANAVGLYHVAVQLADMDACGRRMACSRSAAC